MKFSIEFFTLQDIEKKYEQLGLDTIFKYAKEVINSGGRVEIYREYENSPKEILRTLRTIDEAKEFFNQ